MEFQSLACVELPQPATAIFVIREGSVVEPLRTALFVDFDNLFIGLGADQRPEARYFALNPANWLGWLTSHPLGRDKSTNWERRVLLRRCYLNPIPFGQFRTGFINAGFEVIDCPPLTLQGKTSADIHMAIDMLEALQHPTRFEEFVVMSADADFTPILLRLRAHDRHTVVISGSQASRAYSASCDFHMTQIDFVDGGLSPAIQAAEGAGRTILSPSALTSMRDKARALINQLLQRSTEPIVLATIAHRLNDGLGKSQTLGSNWGGKGTLKGFIRSLEEPDWQIVDGIPGYIYDRKRHTPPPLISPEEQVQQEVDHLEPDLREFVTRVATATGVPALSTEAYLAVFEALVDEVKENGYRWAWQTARGARDRCLDAFAKTDAKNVPLVTRNDIGFIIQGLSYQGERFRADAEHFTANDLAAKFKKNVEGLCKVKQLSLDDDDLARLDRWIPTSVYR
jgi:hypothetical protein